MLLVNNKLLKNMYVRSYSRKHVQFITKKAKKMAKEKNVLKGQIWAKYLKI